MMILVMLMLKLRVMLKTLTSFVLRLTLSGEAVPVLCGTSLHGIGVEALLDAITLYLPSPSDLPTPRLWPAGDARAEVKLITPSEDQQVSEEDGVAVGDAAEGVALAFKVQHESHSKKPLVWIRVYGGVVRAGCSLLNSRTQTWEKPTRLLHMHGEEVREIEEVRVA